MDSHAHPPVYEFEGFRIDGAQRRLLDSAGNEVALPARAFDVLMALVERAGSPLDKATLLATVWPNVVVEEGSLTQCIFTLRRAFGDSAGEHRFIATIPGRGYQFVAPVRAIAGESQAVIEQASAGRRSGSRLLYGGVALAAALIVAFVFWPAPTADEKSKSTVSAPAPATIAVLPFSDLSPAGDMEYFADGIAEELVSSLSKAGRLKVVGRRSTAVFKGGSDDARSIGEKLRVQAILEGSIRKDGDRIRISAQLTSTRDGVNLWGDTYDRKLDDVLDVQGSIAREVVAALAPAMRDSPDARSSTPIEADLTRDAEAYRSYLRGVHLYKQWTDRDLRQARDEFQRAADRDPQFAEAYAWLARTHQFLARRAIGDVADNRSRADAALAKAIASDPAIGDWWWVRMHFVEGDDAPIAIRASGLERALAISEDDAEPMIWLANTYLRQARRAEALRMFERAYVADPLWPVAGAFAGWNAYQYGGDRARLVELLDELEPLVPDESRVYQVRAALAFNEGRALDWDLLKKKAIEVDPTNQPIHGYLSLDYGDLGLLDAAMHHANACITLNPHSAAGAYSIAHIQMFSGNLEGARQTVRETVARKPADYLAQLAQAELRYFSGDCAGATQSFALARPAYDQPEGSLDLLDDPENVAVYVWCLRQQGNTARVAEMSRVFERQYAPPVTPGILDGWRARMAAAVGDREALATHLRALLKSNSMQFAFVRHEPLIQPYLKDPEVNALLDELDARRAEWRRILPKSSMRVPIPVPSRTAGS